MNDARSISSRSDQHEETRADDALTDLFGLFLSGTLAKTETRILAAREALLSDDEKVVARGKKMLRSALKTGFWSPSFHFDADARPEAYGWEPKGGEVVDWFEAWFALAAELAASDKINARVAARSALAAKLGRLWLRVPSLRAPILSKLTELNQLQPWPEGRQSIYRSLHLADRRGETLPQSDVAAAQQVLADLAPTNLEDRIRAEMAAGWEVDIEDVDEGRGIRTATRSIAARGA